MSGWTELLERLTVEATGKALASKAARKAAGEGRYLIGTGYGSWQGLARAIVRKASTTGASTKTFFPETRGLAGALAEWELWDNRLAKLAQIAREAPGPHALPDAGLVAKVAVEAQKKEQAIVQKLRQIGVERKRSAQLLSRIRNLAKKNSPGGEALRSALRQEGGTLSYRARPGTDIILRGRPEGTFQELKFDPKKMHGGRAAFYNRTGGPFGEPHGEINYSVTRDPEADLTIAAHEGLGHGLKQLERTLGTPEDVAAMATDYYESAPGASEDFFEMMKNLDLIAQQAPYRPGWGKMQSAVAQLQAQQRLGRTLPPEEMRRALEEIRATQGTRKFEKAAGFLPLPAKQELARAGWSPKPHSDEEEFADLMAILLDPRARQQLPYQTKVSLSRWFPDAFPGLRRGTGAGP